MAGFTLSDMKKLQRSKKRVRKQGLRDVLTKTKKGVRYDVWGNTIAIYKPKTKKLTVSDAGWATKLTKDRLNKLLPPKHTIRQRKFRWYSGKRIWKGKKTIKV